MPVDYDSIATSLGGVSSEPQEVDYDKVATELGGSIETQSKVYDRDLSVGGYDKPKEPSLLDNIGTKLSERATNVADILQRYGSSQNVSGRVPSKVAGIPIPQPKFGQDFLNVLWNEPAIVMQVGAEGLGAAIDTIGEEIKNLYKSLPEYIQSGASNIVDKALNTSVGKMGIYALAKAGEVYDAFKETYPESAQALEGIMNAAAIGAMGKLSEPAISAKIEARNIVKDAKKLATRNINPNRINLKIDQEIRKGVTKAVRPRMSGKISYGQKMSFNNKAKEGVFSIIDNKKSLRLFDEATGTEISKLPETISETAQALSQRMGSVFDKFDSAATGTKNLVPVDSTMKALLSMTKSAPMQDLARGSVNSAVELAKKLYGRQYYTAKEAQEFIRIANTRLGAYYANPSAFYATEKEVLETAVREMRKALDKTIFNATGVEYQALKNEYGSLKALSEEVGRRAIVLERQNPKGLIDLADIFSGAQAANAIASQNLPLLASSVAARQIKQWYKFANDPNHIIRKMFKKVDALRELQREFVPASRTGKEIGNISRGLKEVSRLKENPNFFDMSQSAQKVRPAIVPKGGENLLQ